ncbi:Wadjet anti-phage system protein JetD domain-containing protein [Zhihengliuella salsuginis]|uniref:DUF3322 and DUF2220 domain-containing protein n=1 Tax=Zhihengliuella salsuginis TaxID=578222 RepID=A0ABQ3GHG7_9MICC|nr:Wadjet anti-phage system protein JetD domain-containing protein [Zhihengliuella salsuginis]GHD05722.1 hypothetical protein GCM10008096_15040 [Zhihengliuella salsuginis]
MITVAEARERLQKTYERKFAAWAVDPFDSGSPQSMPLHPPTDAQAALDLGAVGAWLKAWNDVGAALGGSSVVAIDWEARRWPNSGTQRVPVRLRCTAPAGVAAFLRRSTHWNTAAGRASRLLDLPGPDAAAVPAEPAALDEPVAPDGSGLMGSAVAKVLKKIVALPSEDFERLFDVLAWIVDHPASGLLPRQLPVPGIDSKWYERHRGVVETLNTAATGRLDTGLAGPPKLYRLRFLDDQLAPGGLGDLAASVAELARLQITPQAVVVLENLQTLLALPPIDGVVAIHGGGYDVRWIADLPWIARVPLVYWGDLDADGLYILAALRGILPDAVSVMMDRGTLETHLPFAGADPNPPRVTVPAGLTPAEVDAFAALGEHGHLRLEQERIGWATAVTTLKAALRELLRDGS